MDLKTCTTCTEAKPLSEFYKASSGKGGLTSKCKACTNSSNTAWRLRNAEKVKADRRGRHEKTDKEAERARKIAWNAANRDAAREHSARNRQKVRATPRGKLDHNVSRAILRSIASDGKLGLKTYEVLGYSPDDLMAHLEALFEPGMMWENYGKGGWHLDHKIPLSAHNYDSSADLDFKRAWALTNLQPLWEFDNLSKGAKLYEPFQPSLALAA